MSSRIVSLEIENFKRIVAVEIVPSGGDSCVIIGGKNDQGKSSVLDAIHAAIAGKSAVPEEPLRQGAKSGFVKVDLGDMIVERRFSETGASTLKLTTKDGATYGKPQQMLDALYNRISFDPLKFLSMKPDEQSQTLIEILGIDTRALDRERDEVYEERTGVNRLLKEAESDLNRLPAIAGEDDVPAERPDVLALSNRINEAREIQASHTRHSEHVAELNRQMGVLKSKQAELVGESEALDGEWDADEKELADAQVVGRNEMSARHKRELEDLVSRQTNERERLVADDKKQTDKLQSARAEAIRQNDEAISKGNAAISALEKTLVEETDTPMEGYEDIGDLQAQFQAANANMVIWDAVARKRDKQAVLAKRKGESDSLTKRLEDIAEKKRDMMAKAKYPIDGLAVSDSGSVLFNNVPISQASKSSQIKTSVAIGIAMNPKLPVLLIRDGSLLDEENFQVVREMAGEVHAQVWVERVGDQDACAIIIESGRIKGVDHVVAEAKPEKAEKKPRKKPAKVVAGDEVHDIAEHASGAIAALEPRKSLFAS